MAAAGGPPPADAVLAVVDGTPITVGRFLDELRRLGNVDRADGRAALLEELIGEEVRRQAKEKLAPALAALSVSDDEVLASYRANPQQAAVPRTMRGALITIAVPANASAERRAELRARAEAARVAAVALPASEPLLGNVAAVWSDDEGTRDRGGDMGLLRTGVRDRRWDEAATAALFALSKPGEVSPVVAGKSGFHVVKLVEARDLWVPHLGAVRDQIRQRLLQEKRRAVERQFEASLRAAGKISVDRELLGRLPGCILP